jgi:hypothetical protein
MNAFVEKNSKAEKQSVQPNFSTEINQKGGRSEIQELGNKSNGVKQLQAYQQMADNFTSQSVPRANNTGLPDNLKTGIEQLSGLSMNDVKVHYNSAKPAQLQAHAYAQGTEIHVSSGQEHHLPHEAWHVVQQKQGRVKPTVQLKGKIAINDDAGLEREADIMGERALQMKQNSEKSTLANEQVNASLASHAEITQLVRISYFPAATETVLVEGGHEKDTVRESDGAMVENITKADYERAGSPTNDAVRKVSRFMTNITGIPFIAGHMLNKHLLGEGDRNDNITSISASANSQQSKRVEEPAKAAVRQNNSDVTYWTKVTHRGTVGKNANNHVRGHALQIETGYVDNNTHVGITERIDTVSPLRGQKSFVASGFIGEDKSGGERDRDSQARATTLEFVTDQLKRSVDPKKVFQAFFDLLTAGGRRFEGFFRNRYPNMPDSVIQTCDLWYKRAHFEDPNRDELFLQIEALGSDSWIDIHLAMKYPDKTLWEKLSEFIEANGPIPHDSPQKSAGYILAFQKSL